MLKLQGHNTLMRWAKKEKKSRQSQLEKKNCIRWNHWCWKEKSTPPGKYEWSYKGCRQDFEAETKNDLKLLERSNAGLYPSTFLHLVNGSKNSILHWVFQLNLLKNLQVFSLCLSRKTLDIFFILFTPFFLLL